MGKCLNVEQDTIYSHFIQKPAPDSLVGIALDWRFRGRFQSQYVPPLFLLSHCTYILNIYNRNKKKMDELFAYVIVYILYTVKHYR